MRPKTIVITGASDGIGAAAARQLATAGHHLVLLGRSPDKTAALAREVGATPIVADFSRLDEVRAAAQQILGATSRIDVLANNAGLISPSPRVTTADGHELTNQVNYLAPFLLTRLLMDRLTQSHATVIATSSMAHWLGRIDLADPDHTHGWSAMGAYGTSKLQLLLFTRELQRRFGDAGVNAVAFHPGVVASGFSRGTRSPIEVLYSTPLRVLATPSGKAARTLTFLAEGTPGLDFPPGSYIIGRRPAACRATALDVRLADILWRRTEAWLGLPSH